MELSIYMDLQRKLSNFYIKRVQPNLARYNEIHKEQGKARLLFFILFVSLLLSFICLPVAQLLGFIFLLFFFITFFASFFFKVDKNKEQMDLDNEMKSELMEDFVQIFGDLHWQPGTFITKKLGTAGELSPLPNLPERKKNEIVYSSVLNPAYYKNVEKVKSLNLFNMAILTIDDSINGTYQNVPFSILEAMTISTAKLIIPILAFILFSMLPLAIIIALVLIFGGHIIFISLYYTMINFIASLGVPKTGAVIITAAVFVLAIKFVIQLIINLIKPLMGYFRGVIVEFAMNKNFEGHTIILDNSGDGRKVRIDKRKFEEVKLEDVEFAKNYTVYSTNQIEARYLITTAFIDRLKNLKTKFKSKYIRVAFKDDKIVIAIHTNRDMFKMADMFKESGKETFMALFDEISSVLDFIDQLKLNSKLGL